MFLNPTTNKRLTKNQQIAKDLITKLKTMQNGIKSP